MINDKIQEDFNKYLQNDELNFSHTIDELLLFNKQLNNYFQYPISDDYLSSSYNCLNILCENEAIFSNWLQLEDKICTKNVDLLFSM